MKKPLVSIIMSCYNESNEEVSRSILSILKQTYDNFEFIIILDNPKNKSLLYFLEDFKKKDSRIRLFINKRNLGLAATLNLAIKKSKGEYIARMDADDFSYPERISSQYKVFKENKDIDLCFTWVKYVDENFNTIKIHSPNNSEVQNVNTNFFKNHLFVHPSLFCKKKVFDKYSYDIKYKKAQDFELWLNLINNFNFYILEKELFQYKVKFTHNYLSTKLNSDKYQFGIKALFKYFYKFKFNLYYYIMLVKFIFLYVVLKFKVILKNE